MAEHERDAYTGPPFARILFWLVLAAGTGLLVFGFMAWRATETHHALPAEAAGEFADVLERQPSRPPVLETDPEAGTRRRTAPPAGPVSKTRKLCVLAYHAGNGNVVRTDVPFLLYRIKEPVAGLLLQKTRYDPETLGLNPQDLAKYGPGVVIDERRPNGDRLLVWLE